MMSRSIKATMEKIFHCMERHIDEEDKCRILSITRHIVPDCDKESVTRFVDSCKIKIVRYKLFSLIAFDYSDTKYILIPSNYESVIDMLGLERIDNLSLFQGACMVSISENCMPIKAGTNSLEIIEMCFGIEANGDGSLSIQFSDILRLFEEYILVQIDEDRYQLQYVEDFNRLYGIMLLDASDRLRLDAATSLVELLQSLGSRSIAVSIINSVEGQLLEYTFFQIYQCLEYLFVLNSGLSISSTHGISEVTAVDIVVQNSLKITEEENLYRVLKDNTPESALRLLYDCLSEGEEQNDLCKWVASYIYKVRCRIAHLRYNQDNMLNIIQWGQLIASFSQMVLSTYQKLDNKIIAICTAYNAWEPAVFTTKGN